MSQLDSSDAGNIHHMPAYAVKVAIVRHVKNPMHVKFIVTVHHSKEYIQRCGMNLNNCI